MATRVVKAERLYCRKRLLKGDVALLFITVNGLNYLANAKLLVGLTGDIPLKLVGCMLSAI